MAEKVLKLYTTDSNGSEVRFPNVLGGLPLEIGEFTYNAQRMGGAPTISCSIMWHECLDLQWSDLVYTKFKGEKFYLKQTPSSSQSNTDARWKHDAEFISERFILDNIYFFDVVDEEATNIYGGSAPVSNSTEFAFFGTIEEFKDRLNYSLNFSGLKDKYEVRLDENYKTPANEDKFKNGKTVSISNKFFSQALQEIYNTYELYYYFYKDDDSKTIIYISDNQYTIGEGESPLEYGRLKELISVKKNNANYKPINKITSRGSDQNIPYYYPNPSQIGERKFIYNTNDTEYVEKYATDMIFENYYSDTNEVNADVANEIPDWSSDLPSFQEDKFAAVTYTGNSEKINRDWIAMWGYASIYDYKEVFSESNVVIEFPKIDSISYINANDESNIANIDSYNIEYIIYDSWDYENEILRGEQVFAYSDKPEINIKMPALNEDIETLGVRIVLSFNITTEIEAKTVSINIEHGNEFIRVIGALDIPKATVTDDDVFQINAHYWDSINIKPKEDEPSLPDSVSLNIIGTYSNKGTYNVSSNEQFTDYDSYSSNEIVLYESYYGIEEVDFRFDWFGLYFGEIDIESNSSWNIKCKQIVIDKLPRIKKFTYTANNNISDLWTFSYKIKCIVIDSENNKTINQLEGLSNTSIIDNYVINFNNPPTFPLNIYFIIDTYPYIGNVSKVSVVLEDYPIECKLTYDKIDIGTINFEVLKNRASIETGNVTSSCFNKYGIELQNINNFRLPYTYEISHSLLRYWKPQKNLMPKVYINSVSKERFYLAKNYPIAVADDYVANTNTGEKIEDGYLRNDNYIKNEETGEYYKFENLYNGNNPYEHIIDFPDIKPTIKEMVNANGLRIDMFSEFAYDDNDNNLEKEYNKDGSEGGGTLKREHPYFFGKLRKFDGENGFNLFDHAIENGEMTVAMTNGKMGSCKFVIHVGEETQKNLVQVDANGNLLRDNYGNVVCGRQIYVNGKWEEPNTTNGQYVGKDDIQDRQNDTSKNEVWVALAKDTETFPSVMPYAKDGEISAYQPTASTEDADGNYLNDGDTFVLLNILLPQAYIRAAEERLTRETIKYMAENNKEKFTFAIDFSRIYLAENPQILEKLNENVKLIVRYNGEDYPLYVSGYSYKMSSQDALPEIKVDLAEILTAQQGALQNVINAVKASL